MTPLMMKLIRNQTGLSLETIQALFDAGFEFVIHDEGGFSFYKEA